MLKELLESKKAKQIKVFKKFNEKVLTWEEIVNLLYLASNQKPTLDEVVENDKALDGKIHGNILIKQDLYLYAIATEAPDKCLRIMHEFAYNGIDLGIANYYVNLSGKIDNIPLHPDRLDNFYWQCQGSVEWVGESGKTYIVEPGDLVYAPAGTKHGVNFLSNARAAVGFSGDLSKYE
jgi:mannose-6-phosphate isomerase-like protein (cupin superfamily)